MPNEEHPSTLTSDLLPSGSSNGHGIREELRARATPRQEGLDGSPGGNGVGTSVPGEPPVPTPQEAPAGGLENHRDNCSGAGSKWAVLDELRKFTTLDPQRLCMVRPKGSAPVSIGRRGDSAVFGGVQPCGLRTCPNCGPVIQARRREEIGEAVAGARSMGWDVYFCTLTVGHEAEQGLQEPFDAVFDCWRAVTRGGWWNRAKRAHGIRHWVRVIECKEGGAHGWHPHLHLLLFVEPKGAMYAGGLAALERDLHGRWVETVVAAGYRASLAAQHLVHAEEAHLDALAAYFTKDLGDEIAWEMTDAGGKRDRKGAGSRTPAELLADAAAGDAGAVRAWREFEKVTKGRQLIAWSGNARSTLRVEESGSTGDIVADAAEAAVAATEPRVTVSAEEWQDVASRFGMREALAVVVAASTMPEEVLWWMREHGWTSARLAAPAPPATVGPLGAGPPDRPWLVDAEEAGL